MEKNVEKLASLFKIEPDVIKEALSDETGEKLGGVVQTYIDGTNVFTDEELRIKLDNHSKGYIDKLIEEGKDIPQNLYSKVKGNAFEAYEKKRAKKYGIEEWSSLDDLEDKILASELNKSGKSKDDDANLKEIERLKGLVLAAEEEKKNAVTDAKNDFTNQLIARDVNQAIRSVPIDAEGEKFDNQQKVLATMFRDSYVFEFKDNRTIVKNKETGDLLANKVGDPLPINEVIAGFAPEWVNVKGVPEGGRGGNSTETTNTGKGFKTKEEFFEHCEKNNIPNNSIEMAKAMSEAKAENPDLIFD